jgi:hypothetical protein
MLKIFGLKSPIEIPIDFKPKINLDYENLIRIQKEYSTQIY